MTEVSTHSTLHPNDEDASSIKWTFLGHSTSKSQAVFLAQIIILYIVIITCIVNLSLQHPDKTLWTSLLCSALGYMLPNPSYKPQRRSIPKTI